MTLEVLFARQGQSSTFLQLCMLGLVSGLLLHLSVAVHRRRRAIGAVLDVLGCVAVAAAIGAVLMRSGGGVRLYGLLGFVIGLLLYASGVMQLIRAAAAWLGRRKSAAPPVHDRQAGP